MRPHPTKLNRPTFTKVRDTLPLYVLIPLIILIGIFAFLGLIIYSFIIVFALLVMYARIIKVIYLGLMNFLVTHKRSQ